MEETKKETQTLGQAVTEKVITTMQRYEFKYLMRPEQTAALRERLVGHMEVDKYGVTSIASIYYDTPDYQLIRTSIEKPPFKEKMRLRSYGLAKKDSTLFLELKRKAYGIVYKRRVSTTQELVDRFLNYEGDVCADGQIAREITYFRNYYKRLVPAFLIIYDRTAYFEPGGDLRLTIDGDPRYRATDLNLYTSMEGTPLMPYGKGSAILEVKVQQAVPLWLSEILDDLKIYKGSFSKVGEAYKAQARKIMNIKEDKNA